MTVFRFESKKMTMSLLIWSLAYVGMIWMFMVIYPSFSEDTAMLETMIANYPEEMLKAFGMGTALPLSSIPGYFVFAFAFIQLMIAIQASNYGFGILSVEERDLTADFLMTKPLSRRQIIMAKFLAMLLILTISNGIIWVSSLGFIELYKGSHSYELGEIALLLASILPFQLFFVSIGMLVSLLVKKVRSVISFSMALAFGAYLVNALRAIVDGSLIGVVTPFYHFEPAYILTEGQWNLPLASISLGVSLLALVATYWLYQRRNIHSL